MCVVSVCVVWASAFIVFRNFEYFPPCTLSIPFLFFLQDDTFTDSYISTIGIDFVSKTHTYMAPSFTPCCKMFCICVHQDGHRKWLLTLYQPDFSCLSTVPNFVLFPQKIRTVELDGKTIKLQIVSHYTLLPRWNTDVSPSWHTLALYCSLVCLISLAFFLGSPPLCDTLKGGGYRLTSQYKCGK